MKAKLHSAVLALALLLAGWAAPAWADTAGPNYAGAAGTNNFTNPADATGSGETTCASLYGTSHNGFWKAFGFNIPSNATIAGIQVEYKRSWTADPPSATAPEINIGKNETTLGTAKVDTALASEPATLCGATQAIASFGGPADKWGLTWTPAEINATGFTIRLRNATGWEYGWNINWIRVTVTYCVSPSDVDYAAVNAQSSQGIVYWSSPNPALIFRKAGTPFTSEAPANGTTYAVGDSIGTATVVYNGAVPATSFTQTGLTNGTTYYYKVFAKTGTGAATCYAVGTYAGSGSLNASPAAGPYPSWSYMLAGGSILKAGIAGQGTIYTSSNASWIISLSTADGTQSWTPVATNAAIQGWLTWLPLSGGTTSVVIGGDQAGKVYSVNAATGAKSWTEVTTGADAIQASAAAQVRDWSNAAFQAAYTTDVIFAASRNTSTTNNKLFAIRASDGAVLWTFNGTGAYAVDYIVGMPYVDYARNRIYVASRAGTAGTQDSLWVINTLDGTRVTSFAVGHLETSPTLSYDGNTLYVGNKAGNLYAIDTNILAQKWTSPAALGTAIVGFVWEDYATAGRLYFSTADGNAWCLQDAGAGAPPDPASPVWKRAVAAPSTPVLLDKLYVGSSDGKLHQLRLTDGYEGAPSNNPLTIGDGTKTVGDASTEDGAQVFVGTTEGKIYKLPLPLP